MLSNPAPWVVPWLRHDPWFERQVQLIAKVLEKVALKSQRRLATLLNGFCERKDNIFDFSLKGMANVSDIKLWHLYLFLDVLRSCQDLFKHWGWIVGPTFTFHDQRQRAKIGLQAASLSCSQGLAASFSSCFLFGQVACVHDSSCLSGWWFQIFFIFTPTWGRFPIWLIFFKGVETTN